VFIHLGYGMPPVQNKIQRIVLCCHHHCQTISPFIHQLGLHSTLSLLVMRNNFGSALVNIWQKIQGVKQNSYNTDSLLALLSAW